MGSTGTGRLTDYSDTKTSNKGKLGSGSSGEDPCSKAFSATLEEVDRCEYFIKHKSLPPIGTEVIVEAKKRIEVLHKKTAEIIGYLPTRCNYLLGCISTGWIYGGVITLSTDKPIIKINVDIAPSR